jgi:hypothetical protein
MAGSSKGWAWRTFMVDGSGGGSGLSSSFGEVNGGGSLRPQRSLALVQLHHLGVEGHLLASKLIVVRRCPPLGIDLSSVGSCLLLLPVSLLLIEAEFHSWLGYHRPQHDHQDGLESWSVLWGWHVGDGFSQGHHVTPSGVEGSRATIGA